MFFFNIMRIIVILDYNRSFIIRYFCVYKYMLDGFFFFWDPFEFFVFPLIWFNFYWTYHSFFYLKYNILIWKPKAMVEKSNVIWSLLGLYLCI